MIDHDRPLLLSASQELCRQRNAWRKQAEAWKKAAEYLEELAGYDEIDHSGPQCPMATARKLEEEQ